MRYKTVLGAVAGLFLIGAALPADPTADEIRQYAEQPTASRTYPMGPIAQWEADLKQQLLTATPRAAADRVAARYHVKPAVMRALVPLWLDAKINQYAPRAAPGRAERLRAGLRAQLAAAGRVPLVLQIVAEALDMVEECDADDFAAMLQGSKDPAGDAWIVANSAVCSANFARAMTAAPDRAMPALIREVDYGGIDAARDKLPLLAWLASPEALAHVAAPDRSAAAAILTRDYALALFEAGLSQRGIALVDGLPPEMRARVLRPEREAVTLQIDGLAVSLGGGESDDTLRADLAAAYAVAGRDAEARALLAAMPGLAAARARLECASKPFDSPRPACHPQRQGQGDPPLLILDHYLNSRAEDPYLIAEYVFGGGMIGSEMRGATTEIECRVFAEPQYAEICAAARETARDAASAGPRSWNREGRDAAMTAVDRLALPGLSAIRAELDSALLAFAGPARPEPDYHRASTNPAPPPFVQAPLPAAYRKRGKEAAWDKAFAPLPEGHLPVRVERQGERVVAISVSQDLDPTGEVSQGGYWVIVSGDGGKHWGTPHYTGLAANFPYVVVPDSAMPMIDGDQLKVEVEVAEIDTASITYPPVGLRTRRRERGLYLTIPLADLIHDSDGDGLTDIAAHRLLLDTPRAAGATPFVLGSAAASCRGDNRTTLAIGALLDAIFRVHAHAIVEGVDRSGEAAIGPWRGAAQSNLRPMFIEGDPADYACLAADRPIIVYSHDDIARLERFSPDFHAVSLPRIVHNRAFDRGYVQWSLGWTGGAFRMRWSGDKWVLEQTSSWIT